MKSYYFILTSFTLKKHLWLLFAPAFFVFTSAGNNPSPGEVFRETSENTYLGSAKTAIAGGALIAGGVPKAASPEPATKALGFFEIASGVLELLGAADMRESARYSFQQCQKLGSCGRSVPSWCNPPIEGCVNYNPCEAASPPPCCSSPGGCGDNKPLITNCSNPPIDSGCPPGCPKDILRCSGDPVPDPTNPPPDLDPCKHFPDPKPAICLEGGPEKECERLGITCLPDPNGNYRITFPDGTTIKTPFDEKEAEKLGITPGDYKKARQKLKKNIPNIVNRAGQALSKAMGMPKGWSGSKTNDTMGEDFSLESELTKGKKGKPSSKARSSGGSNQYLDMLAKSLKKDKKGKRTVQSYKPLNFGKDKIGTAYDNIFQQVSKSYKSLE